MSGLHFCTAVHDRIPVLDWTRLLLVPSGMRTRLDIENQLQMGADIQGMPDFHEV